MIRFLLILLIVSILAWLGLHKCTRAVRPPLSINPTETFPQEKNALLGQSMARILTHCPGFQRHGALLEFMDLTEDGDAITLHFTAPHSPNIPAEWGARGLQCTLRVEKDAFILDAKAGCQALCLGEQGTEGQEVRVELKGRTR